MTHKAGIQNHLANLRVLDDSELDTMCIDLDHLYTIDLMGRNKMIPYMNIEGQGLKEIPKVVLKFENLKKLNIFSSLMDWLLTEHLRG